jgi:hypothetical protein
MADTPASSSDTNLSSSLSDISDSVDTAVSGNQEASEGQEAAPEASGEAQQAAATLSNPKASKAAKVEAKKTLKKLTLKVDGEEYEQDLPFDLPDDPKAIEYMKRELQMAKMGQNRAQHAANLEKEIVQFFDELKANPKKALSNPAFKDRLDLKKLAAEIIEEEIENSKKSPEQLEKEKLQAELQAMKEERENEKRTLEQREFDRLREKYAEDYDIQITQALETNKIPRSAAAVKKIADYMEIAVKAGKDVSVNDLIPIIRDELSSDFLQHLNSLPDDQLDQYIPKAIQDRLRKRVVAKAKAAASNPVLKGNPKAESTGKASEKKEDATGKKTMRQLWGV